ncbi:MAG: DEAD/DEAH box helicase [Treponema sp.]|jgi:ATP-dependent RNA helicase DeaD|nr:DEAD/DEAH box helicase [Treponema sp.]
MVIDENHPFSSFGLSDAMLQAIARKGWTAPSSIQSIALPRLLADEGHCIVKARTGTGKTAAFGIPLIERLTQAGHTPRALILTPTRELALQVSREIASLVSGHYPRVTAVYGGASIRNQILDLRRGTEIVVGTPGRIMDLMERKALDLAAVDWFILDEADEMLDMGFFEDVEKIMEAVKAHEREQPAGARSALHIALFSATMPEPILKVVRKHIGDVEIIVDAAPDDEKPLVDQLCVIIKREDKLEALRRIIDSAAEFYGLIFCATKVETDELARRLIEAGYHAEALHGDLSQEIRERTLRRFRLHRAAAVNSTGAGGEPAILAATDVAARGLDIENLSHVINWDLPNDRETYLHRIGRTGRAGRRGIAISLATLAERGRIHQFSRMMEKNLGIGAQGGILWLKVPSVKAVMKALRRRITSAVIAALPEQELISLDGAPAAEAESSPSADENAHLAPFPVAPEAPLAAPPVSPFLDKVCHTLIERLGAEKAVEALVSLNFGDFLDPARYGPITEFSEEDFKDTGRGMGRGRDDKRRGRSFAEGRKHPSAFREGRGFGENRRSAGGGRQNRSVTGEFTRLYVGQGRQHGLGARDIAALLMRAGGIPGRLVDEIEVKDYCSFATLPADAARKACAYSRTERQEPIIRIANR